MIRREGRRIFVSGPVTLGNVARVLEEGRQHFAEGVQQIDLAEVTEMDSALLGLLFGWLREARSAQREIAFVNLPDALRTLAHLYGVDGLLPAARPS